MLHVALLGPLEVTCDGAPLRVPAGRTAELLVRLALDAGELVSADRLVDDLWGPDAVDTRRNTLQSKIARLRRALDDGRRIASGGGGYRLDVDRSAVDALAVLDEAMVARRLHDAGDDRSAADACASALSRYRGDLIPTAGDGEWVRVHRARLDEARTMLIETQFAARLRLGGGADLIGELEVAVATSPFQEGLWELLITAQYRAGRQADALATYRRVRIHLADELGLGPGPRLQALEQQILVHDPSLEVPAPSVPAVDPRRSGNLPSMSGELIGRDTELAALVELVAFRRLVAVVGPGGVGKTTLALAAGRESTGSSEVGPAGVWLARLETAVTADDVVDTLIAALDVSSETALFERLKPTTALVILDNCEHVVEDAAALAVRLLDAAPGVRILCTSQVPLDVDGEAVLELAPLALADAVELFTRRASTQRTHRSTIEADDAVLDLCRSLDGLPLAIELAAARTKTLSIDEITRRLDDRFHVLSDPTSRRPERRRALKSTIRWSYDLLFPDDQRGLWALATFAGGAPLPAVESVLDALDVPATATIDILGRLISRSLVIVDDGSSSSPDRYRLLDSIRAFALEAMDDVGMTEHARAAHAAWFAGAAARSTDGVRSSRQAEHLSVARTERANIDAALAWSAIHDPLLALGLVNGFGWAWIVLGDVGGADRILTALRAAGDDAPARARADALLLASWIEASAGRLEPARAHVAAATELADEAGDVDMQARCSYYLAYVVSHQGEFRRALELTDRADTLYRDLDRPWDQAANWLFAARAAISRSDRERTVEAVAKVQHWLRGVDDPWLRVRLDAALGEVARIEHRFDDAVAHLARAAETSGRLGFLQTEAYQLTSLGRARCQAGDHDLGAATLELAIDKAESTGDVRLAALARVHLGRVLRALGEEERAGATLEAAVAWHRAAGGGELAALGECLLATVRPSGEVAERRARLASILDEAHRNDDAVVEVFALDALARIAAEDGDIDTARRLGERADRRMADASHLITDLDRTDARLVKLRA